MIKKDLIQKISERLNITLLESEKKITDVFLGTIKETIEKGEEIELRNFGNFRIKLQKSPPVRNPKTGDEFNMTPRRIVKFKSSKNLKIKK